MCAQKISVLCGERPSRHGSVTVAATSVWSYACFIHFKANKAPEDPQRSILFHYHSFINLKPRFSVGYIICKDDIVKHIMLFVFVRLAQQGFF